MTSYIAPYILESEYMCGCGECGGLPPAFRDDQLPTIYTEFFDDFSVIRNVWGKPINISSGYRCPKYNASIGGSLLSAHCFGIALDCDVEPSEVDDLDAIIEDIASHLRRGKYTGTKSFIHLDVAYEIYPRARLSWTQGYRWTG